MCSYPGCRRKATRDVYGSKMCEACAEEVRMAFARGDYLESLGERGAVMVCLRYVKHRPHSVVCIAHDDAVWRTV